MTSDMLYKRENLEVDSFLSRGFVECRSVDLSRQLFKAASWHELKTVLQDLGRGLGSRKTGLDPPPHTHTIILLLTVPRRCSWCGSSLSDLNIVINMACFCSISYTDLEPHYIWWHEVSLWYKTTRSSKAKLSKRYIWWQRRDKRWNHHHLQTQSF